LRRTLVLLLAALLATACGSGGDKEKGPPLAPQAAQGQRLVEQKGCLACHSTDGSRSQGPTWKGAAGSQVKLTDGATVTADAAYLRRSILDPDAQTVAGFPAALMAARISPGTVTEEEASAIVAYIETLH
jgi:cytochrome c oxidase subunit II